MSPIAGPPRTSPMLRGGGGGFDFDPISLLLDFLIQ
jgi:hypothetical protein